MVYLDDVIVFRHSFDETMDKLKEVLRPLHRTRLKLKLSKYLLFQKNMEFVWPQRICNRHCYAREQNRCYSGLTFVPKHQRSPSVHETQQILQTFRQKLFHYRFAAVRIIKKK